MSLFTRERHDPEVSDTRDERSERLARRRFLRRQWARRWLAWRRLVVALLAVVLVVGGVWLVFFSSVLAVAGVRVDGTHVLSPATVRAAAAVPTGRPLATVDLGAISARVEALPAVERVDVSRSWPDHIRVAVTERTAVAVVASGGSTTVGGTLHGVDAHGVEFRTYGVRPPGLPLVRARGRLGPAVLAQAATVAASLPADLAARVRYLQVHSVDSISLELRNGHQVRWGSAADSVTKAQVTEALLGQRASFYDVSVPGQPVIKK